MPSGSFRNLAICWLLSFRLGLQEQWHQRDNMFLFFLLIQDTCPFFWGMCDIWGFFSTRDWSPVAHAFPNRPVRLGPGPTGPPHTHKKTWAAEYTKFEESGSLSGFSRSRLCSGAEYASWHLLPLNMIALVDCPKSLMRGRLSSYGLSLYFTSTVIHSFDNIYWPPVLCHSLPILHSSHHPTNMYRASAESKAPCWMLWETQ